MTVPIALMAGPASAAPAPVPGNFYYTDLSTTSTTLYERTPDGVETPITLTAPVNSLALDPTDQQLYAIGTPTSPDHLQKVNLDGTVTDLGAVPGLSVGTSGQSFAVAAFDEAGNLWVGGKLDFLPATPFNLWKIDVDTLTVMTTLTLTDNLLGDLAFVGDELYARNASLSGLFRVDTTTGALTSLDVSGPGPGGAMFSTDGHLYASSGTDIVEFIGYDTATPSAVVVGTLSATGDGASDSTAASPFLAATDDAVGTSIPRGTSGGNVFVNDLINGQTLAAGDVTATIVADSESTGVTIGADGSLVVPSTVPVGTYSITYQICETANSLVCDTAIVTFAVVAAELAATGSTGGGPVIGFAVAFLVIGGLLVFVRRRTNSVQR